MESASYSGGRSVTLGLTDVLSMIQTDHNRPRNGTGETTNGALRHVDPEERSLGQKIDQLITLCLDNKFTMEAIQRDSEATKQDLTCLTSEVSSIKTQILQSEQSKGGGGRKKRIVPTVLSVRVKP